MNLPVQPPTPSEDPSSVAPQRPTGPRRRGPRWAFYGVLALITLGLLVVAIPNFMQSRVTACTNSCIANLKQIDGAKQQWALEYKKTPSDFPTVEEVSEYLKARALPKCPEGGTYTLNAVGENPSCSVAEHAMSPLP